MIMPTMKPALKLLTALLLTAPLASLQGAESDPLAWPQPTRDAKPWTAWWWMGSAVDKATITREMTEFHEAGLGGVEVGMFYGAKGAEDRYIDFLSPRWMEMLAHASNEAQRLGMRLDMATVAGWPFGGPNVSTAMASSRVNVTSYPLVSGERLMTRLPSRRPTSELSVKSNADGQIALPKESLGELQAVVAVSEDGEQMDVTERVSEDGQLDWITPAGRWQLWVVSRIAPIQTVKRPTPGNAGYALDPFSASAMTEYVKRFSDAFAGFPAPKPNAQFHESFEYFGADWSLRVFDAFQQKRGYDLRTQLPAFAGVGTDDVVARVRCDYRETMSDLHLDYLKTWSDWAHEQGSLSRNQAHGSPGNMLDHYAAADIPETEAYKQDRSLLVMKFASSAAHTTGKPLVSSETGTWVKEHFTETLGDLKALVDDFFLGGVNRVKFHGAASSPSDVAWPGWMFYAATQFNSRNPIWRDVPAFTSYVTRCQSVLQAGQPDNDLLLYWPVHDLWKQPAEYNTPTQKAAGALPHHNVHERAWFEAEPVGDIATRLWQRGYGFDFISDRQLSAATVNRGIALAGSHYQVILVPPCETMPETTLTRLLSLVEAGATVIFTDHLPKDVPGLAKLVERREAFRKLLARLVFANDPVKVAKLGKGKVLLGSADAALNEAKVLRETMTDSGLLFIRRTEASRRHYFITNRSGKAFDGWLPIATPAQSVVILEPMTGRSGIATMRSAESQTQVYLQIQPGESLILRTLTEEESIALADEARWTYSRSEGQPIVLSGTWKVDFIQGGPALPPPTEITTLASWTNLSADAARFAGTARYRLTFDAPQPSADYWLLDLGTVAQSARIRLNGTDLGTRFAAPYQVTIPALKPQGNELEIEVTNVAANRIRDLDQRRVEWRIFHDINFMSITGKRFDASAWPLTDSGLLGPVTLQATHRLNAHE
jgi:alpha-L-rhamnosidase